MSSQDEVEAARTLEDQEVEEHSEQNDRCPICLSNIVSRFRAVFPESS